MRMLFWVVLFSAACGFLDSCASQKTLAEMDAAEKELRDKTKQYEATRTQEQIEELRILNAKLVALQEKVAQEKRESWASGLDVSGVAVSGIGSGAAVIFPVVGIIANMVTQVLSGISGSLRKKPVVT